MALSIKDPEADRLARELADRTGETLTEAVVKSLRERVATEKARSAPTRLAEALGEIGRRCATLPVIDERSPEEILGYDEDGLPSWFSIPQQSLPSCSRSRSPRPSAKRSNAIPEDCSRRHRC
jgi:antitoxin VapB